MTFRADRRGRIPFAFLGAVLLLTSSLYVTALTPPSVTEPVAEEIATDAQMEARLALETAIREAERAAAAEPIIVPSPDGMGSILPENDTFRHALELRIAWRARAALRVARVTREGISASVALPPITDTSSARRALHGVSVEAVDGDRYRITVGDLRVTVRRRGRLVDRSRYTATITLDLPAMALHERTIRFESRLDAGLANPGFTRDLTARLFPIVWVRGYAQYGGAPIPNVLANRHVELMANDALLAQQAAVFGTVDPRGRRAMGVAAADVATRDLFTGAEELLRAQLTMPRTVRTENGPMTVSPQLPQPSVVSNEQSVDADHTADEAFLAFLEGREGPSLRETVDRVYRGSVRVDGHASFRTTEISPVGSPPPNSTRVFSDTDTERWLAGGHLESGAGSTLRTYDGRVIEETTTTHYWLGNRTVGTTERVERRTYDVTLDLRCRYRPPGILPGRPDSSCPFGDPVREQLAEAGVNRLLSGGSLEEIAEAAVEGDGDTGWRQIDLVPPETVRDRAYLRTAALRDAVRGISVSVETRSIASSTNPAAELRTAILTRRSALLGTLARDGSVADRAVAATRVRYLDRTVARLGSRTPMVQRAQNALSHQLQTRLVPSEPPARSSPTTDDYVATVSGSPAYLSSAPPEGAPRMDVRNVNLFTLPYGDAADAVAGRIESTGSRSVSLHTAARTLAAVGDAGAGGDRQVRALGRELEGSMAVATDRYESVLSGSMDGGRAHRIVAAAVTQWPDVSDRALAVTDGRMARAIGAALPPGLAPTDRDRIRVELRVASTEIRSEAAVQVPQSLVEAARVDVQSGASRQYTAVAGTLGGELGKRAIGRNVTQLPAGLPLLPVPGYWYATANAWTVSVRGSYDRFAVTARRTAPGGGSNGTVEYVREDTPVRLDLDRDGRPELLGSNREVQFAARTGVVIVVPPGRTGVGDRGGNAIETSPGW
ncbi:MAG: hypothetical protein ABEJ60_05435 [Halodesulfurarchaeum sp.]